MGPADLSGAVAPARFRWVRLQEIGLAAIGIAAFIIFPDDLAFLTQIAIMGVFVMSLSLVLGQAGIASMGHAAMFGTGAYAAGLFALHISSDPLIGLGVGAGAGALISLASGAIVLRTGSASVPMLTIAVAQVLLEIANKARTVTGGEDGLSGYQIGPILGRFSFDFYGQVAFLYALAVLVLCHFLLRAIFRSPFGLTCRAIRQERERMHALGCGVYRQLLAAYTLGGLFAGLAGALSAQVTNVVGLDTLAFQLSTGALVMLVVGGVRRLSGALIGAVVYMVIQRVASAYNPHYWLFMIGFLLIVSMLALPNGLIAVIDLFFPASRRRRAQR